VNVLFGKTFLKECFGEQAQPLESKGVVTPPSKSEPRATWSEPTTLTA